MPKDPSLEALAALRIAVDLFNDHPGDDEESVEYHRKVATADMADNRYTGTMPTTGAGIAAALEWLFFTDEDEQLSGACSPRTQRFVRLLIEAARRLDEPQRKRRAKPMPQPAIMRENVVELQPRA